MSERFPDVDWICDRCGAYLNIQPGFNDDCDSWRCTECGYRNSISSDNIFDSEEEYQQYAAGSQDSCGSYSSSDSFREDESTDDSSYGDAAASSGGITSIIASAFADCVMEGIEEAVRRRETAERAASLQEAMRAEEEADQQRERELEQESGEEQDSWFEQAMPDEEPAGVHRIYTEEGRQRDDAGQAERARKLEKRRLRKIRMKAWIFNKKNIPVGSSLSDLVETDYAAVRTRLAADGFKNIRCIPVKDIYTDNPHEPGAVKQVVIGGQSQFETGACFPYDSEIIVSYHMKKEITNPYSSRQLKKRDQEEVTRMLFGLGFTEIYTLKLKDIITGWLNKEGSVDKVVTVTGDDEQLLEKDHIYVYDVKIRIYYHGKKW